MSFKVYTQSVAAAVAADKVHRLVHIADKVDEEPERLVAPHAALADRRTPFPRAPAAYSW